MKNFLGIFFFFQLYSFGMSGLVDTPVGCTQFPIIKTALCSGRGQCILENGENRTIINEPNVPGSRCICDNGWTGVNDFVNMDTHDCGQNLIVIRIIWICVLISVSISIIVIVSKLSQSYFTLQEYLEAKNSSRQTTRMTASDEQQTEPLTEGGAGGGGDFPRRVRGKEQKPYEIWLFWLRWPIVTASLLAFGSSFPMTILALIRIINPELAVGVWPFSTVLGVIGEAFFVQAERAIVLSWLEVQGKVLRFTAEDEAVAKRTMHRLKQFIYISFIFDIARPLLTLLILGIPPRAALFLVFYYLCLIGTVLIQGIGILMAGGALIRIISDGLDTLKGEAKEQRELTLSNLKKNVEIHRNSIYGTIVLAVIQGFWPFVRAHHSYSLISCVSMGVLLSSHLIGMSPPILVTQRKESTKERKSEGDKNLSPRESKAKHKTSKQSLDLNISPIKENEEGGVGNQNEVKEEKIKSQNKNRIEEEDIRMELFDKEQPSSTSAEAENTFFDSSTRPLTSSNSSVQTTHTNTDLSPLSSNSPEQHQQPSPADPPIFNPFKDESLT